jgi:hypothetical protein
MPTKQVPVSTNDTSLQLKIHSNEITECEFSSQDRDESEDIAKCLVRRELATSAYSMAISRRSLGTVQKHCPI